MWFFRKKEKTPDESQQDVVAFESNVSEKAPLVRQLREGLSRSSEKISSGISGLFTKKKLSTAILEELEEILISGDLGPSTAAKLAQAVGRQRLDKEISSQEILEILAEEIAKFLLPAEKTLEPSLGKPFVILMVGVNGAGKTTTLGKMAAQYQQAGKKVLLVAGDTFRAAAVDQLKIWGDRARCAVLAKETGADAAALAYESIDAAIKADVDVILLDTAGRLQNKANLMEELGKIVRVLKKKMPESPHATVLVLDASVGQNAYSQVALFKETVELSGLIVTKLDGTAKGGVVVGLTETFGLPIYAIGVGEGIDDLRPFHAREYARALVGLDPVD